MPSSRLVSSDADSLAARAEADGALAGATRGRDAVRFDAGDGDQARVDAAEAGFERPDQRQAKQLDFDGIKGQRGGGRKGPRPVDGIGQHPVCISHVTDRGALPPEEVGGRPRQQDGQSDGRPGGLGDDRVTTMATADRMNRIGVTG